MSSHEAAGGAHGGGGGGTGDDGDGDSSTPSKRPRADAQEDRDAREQRLANQLGVSLAELDAYDSTDEAQRGSDLGRRCVSPPSSPPARDDGLQQQPEQQEQEQEHEQEEVQEADMEVEGSADEADLQHLKDQGPKANNGALLLVHLSHRGLVRFHIWIRTGGAAAVLMRCRCCCEAFP